MRAFGLVVLATGIMLTTEIAGQEPPPKLPKADVRGTVTQIDIVEAFGYFAAFQATGKKEPDTKYEKAYLTIGVGTKFYQWQAGKKAPAKFDDLKVGCKVQVVFSGTVDEKDSSAYSSAKEVLILESPKQKK